MKYELTKPCLDCPFRSDSKFYLRRSSEIADGLLNNIPFACHKTTTQKGKSAEHKDAQHCGGALVLLEKINKPHLAMILGRQLGLYDPSKIDLSSPVYNSIPEFIEGTSC